MARPIKEDKQNPTDYKRQFNAKTYDRLYPSVKKGKKDRYLKAAAVTGRSLNEFMESAMDALATEILGAE